MKSHLSSRTRIETVLLKRPKGNLQAAICYFHLPISLPLDELEVVLGPDEKEYFSSLKYETRKRSFLIGRYAAKQAVAALVREKDLRSIIIQQGIFNQPIVRCGDERNIQVSITHCNELGAAIAFPEAHPMGIDLERPSPEKREVFEKQTTDGEKDLIKAFLRDYDTYLALLWTAKEALSKVLKTGLMTPFKIFELDMIEVKDDHFVGHFRNFAQYKTFSFTMEQYACSIICPKNTELKFQSPKGEGIHFIHV